MSYLISDLETSKSKHTVPENLDFIDYLDGKSFIIGLNSEIYQTCTKDDFTLEILISPQSTSRVLSTFETVYQKMLHTLFTHVFHHDFGVTVDQKTVLYIPGLHSIVSKDVLYLKKISHQDITTLESHFLLDLHQYMEYNPTIIEVAKDFHWNFETPGHHSIRESLTGILPKQFVSNPI